MDTSYDVRLWKMEVRKGAKTTSYRVRWTVDSMPHAASFRNRAQALSFESELRSAFAKGEAFDRQTGRPVSWGRRDREMSWYDFCLAYVDMKWKSSSGHQRANIAWALLLVTPVMLTTTVGMPDAKKIRVALRRWGFNTKQRRDCPAEEAQVLGWVARNSKPVAGLGDSKVARAVLEASATRVDGKPAAASSRQRNRAILHNAGEYAVELGLLAKNPFKAIKQKTPQASGQVDRRCVANHNQVRRLLDAVRNQQPSGSRLVTFFAVIYYSALRPEEAANLSRENLTLPDLVRDEQTQVWKEPDDGWGELYFSTAAPELGAEWTDTGTRREPRQLKSRAEGEWRRVPVPPPLTRLLRQHLEEFGTSPDRRLFLGVQGGTLPEVTYRRAWEKARKTALTPDQYASALARRVYDLRHACVSTWLNGGVPPAQVAEWAGHSVAVLLRVYAKCIDGQDELAKRRIESALRV